MGTATSSCERSSPLPICSNTSSSRAARTMCDGVSLDNTRAEPEDFLRAGWSIRRDHDCGLYVWRHDLCGPQSELAFFMNALDSPTGRANIRVAIAGHKCAGRYLA